MSLFNFFERRKQEREDTQWLMQANFDDCLELLFTAAKGDATLDETTQRRMHIMSNSKQAEEHPWSVQTVFSLLLHYHGIVPQNMEIVTRNVAFGVHEMLCESEDTDPYKAKALWERFFEKWPQAFRKSVHAAGKKDTENNLTFLACVHLFGWDEDSDASKVKEYVERIYALDDIRDDTAYLWLKAKTKK